MKNATLPNADVLIVDDDFETREMLSYFLKKKGYSVVCAVDREEAMSILDGRSVTTILLDYMMPGPSATKFLEYTGWHHPLAKVVLMTASNRADVLARMLGIQKVLAKPLELNRVIETVGVAGN